MVGSRFERIGTIYSRLKGLMDAGGIKYADRPFWYDIYERFPPKYEPAYGRTVTEKPIRMLFYPEDQMRALFYKKFPNAGFINMMHGTRPSISQLFIEEYIRLKSVSSNLSDDQIMELAVESLVRRGIRMDKSRPAEKSTPENTWETSDEAPSHTSEVRPILRVQDLFLQSLEEENRGVDYIEEDHGKEPRN